MFRRTVDWVRRHPFFPLLLLGAAFCLACGALVYSCASHPKAEPDASRPPEPSPLLLRVLLAGATGKEPVTVRVRGEALLYWGSEGGTPAPPDTELTFGTGPRGLSLPGRPPASRAVLKGKGDCSFLVGDREYGGRLEMEALEDGGLRVVNETGLERYLLGVVGGEMPPSWELEALKAQAVAARTYAAARRRDAREKGAPFDVFDDTRSQVYVGVPSGPFSDRIARAVHGTTSEVLVWSGNLLTAFFHSTCGGHTEDASRIFGVAGSAPLRGVVCETCRESPVYRWEVNVAKEDLEAALGVGQILSVSGVDPGPSGRCLFVAVEWAEGRKKLPSHAFRRDLGYTVLRSTAFEAEAGEEGFLFRGRGFGHGVGLCQWGARGLAKEGKRYIDILKHYYPGALILSIEALGAAE